MNFFPFLKSATFSLSLFGKRKGFCHDFLSSLDKRNRHLSSRTSYLHGVGIKATFSKGGLPGYEDLRDVDKQLQTEGGIIAPSFSKSTSLDRALSS